jgi:hypothetical protein
MISPSLREVFKTQNLPLEIENTRWIFMSRHRLVLSEPESKATTPLTMAHALLKWNCEEAQ